MLDKGILIVLTVTIFLAASDSYAKKYKKDGNQGKKYFSIHGQFVSSYDIDITTTTQNFGGFPFDSELDSGFGFGGAIGCYAGDRFRVEAELTYRKNSVSSITVAGFSDNFEYEMSFLNWMASAYYTVPINNKYGFYVGGGAGFSSHSDYDWGTVLAYQGMVGVDMKLDQVSSIAAGYRFFGTNEFSSTVDDSFFGRTEQSFNIDQHIYELSYRLKF